MSETPPTLFGFPVVIDPTMETGVIELLSLVDGVPVVVRMIDADGQPATADLNPKPPLPEKGSLETRPHREEEK